jgi:hypothetical protein
MKRSNRFARAFILPRTVVIIALAAIWGAWGLSVAIGSGGGTSPGTLTTAAHVSRGAPANGSGATRRGSPG